MSKKIKINKIYNIKFDIEWSEWLADLSVSARMDLQVGSAYITIPICMEYGSFNINWSSKTYETVKKIYGPVDRFLEEKRDEITKVLDKAVERGLSNKEINFNEIIN